MKRDWELVRKILIKLEEKVDDSDLDSDCFKKYPSDVVAYHYKLLSQAGLIEIIDNSTVSEEDFSAKQLTWQGHEFLNQIRHDTAWNKIKATLKNKGIDISFEAIKVVSKTFITSLLS
ncbi:MULTISPECIES: DUF2513 domain-containing protein [Pasteurellaceae]|uniref:DUF2513 domain-containing protein n=1 Tax=Phocoenobacter skyensis TaxID=97481 RepID=A0A1H7V8S5_9PAST|nr:MULTISPECIES: DUF2513 domain-containing protein [Pasteurella]MBR0574171.1 DUF2513 domain-containing protein [Pasteurella atlantica]MDP8039280.1 DUF2513 domain-containing protein [Pasteurella atlantica]MDP8041372.1 DUF2513 domain-containing protein [Pasteurella atlantica]MDP8043508.1 DUF2513 domain-containing protein [Pasteurella atlantica]MDP8045574.1 DUF2513 domain-containing protein [Pasteurella atlantica]